MASATIPLAVKSDPAKREVVTSERLVNLYASKSPTEARSPFYLSRTPGMSVWSSNSSNLCRGLFDADTEGLGLYGQVLFSFDEDGAANSIGTITGTTDVRWSQNNATARETAIVASSGVYQYKAGALTTVSSGLPADAIDTVCWNGFTFYIFANRKVYYSAVNDADSIDAFDFFTVPGTGALRAGMVVSNQLFLWGENNFEVYRHVPTDANDPFQLLSGAGKQFGCINTFANANIGGLICFVDQYGIPRTFGDGYSPASIANEGVQEDIEELEGKSEIRLWGYISGDRGFLVVRSSEFCWVYDFKEQRWHNRTSYQRTTWQAKYHMNFANKNLVAPDQSGGVFYLDESSATEGEADDAAPIVWDVVCPPLTNFPGGGEVFSVDLDIEVGTALGSSAATQDQEPVITMYRSVDGGKTYSTGRQASLGTRGKWRKRVTWNRCGSFGREGLILRFTGSAGVPHALMNLAADIKPVAA